MSDDKRPPPEQAADEVLDELRGADKATWDLVFSAVRKMENKWLEAAGYNTDMPRPDSLPTDSQRCGADHEILAEEFNANFCLVCGTELGEDYR